METENNRNKLIAGVAVAALVLGGGGIMLGRTMFAPETTAAAAAPAEEAEEEGHVEGQILMEESRAKAAGIVTEALQSGGLGAEILAQGVVASTPEGEAVLTARADGAVVRINRQLGDFVRAGESVAVMESRDAASIAAERSSASANLALARSTYAREKKLFDAKVTARQDLEGAQAALAAAEAEARRSQSAASAAKVSGDGRTLGVVSLISGRVTKADAKLGSYVLAGTELFRVSDPNRIQINASVLAADARRIKPRGGGDSALIALPEEAVQTVEGKEVVFVKTAKGFQATTVVTGTRGGGRIEIVDGLAAGAVVVTKGAFMLKAELGKGEAEH